MSRPHAAGDEIAAGSQIIEVRVSELRQLFNAIDPSPFRERDLDPGAEAFIVDWARDLPRDAPLALRVHLERAAGRTDEAALLAQAIHQYFRARAAGSRRNLRELFQRGRISLVIGLAFLGVALTLSDLMRDAADSGFAVLVREGFVIGGWVAMWRPLEIFLYDWWPILRDVRLFDRLGAMPVRIQYPETVSDEAWRSDWPALPRAGRHDSHPRGDGEEAPGRRLTGPSPRAGHQHTRDGERHGNPNADDRAALDRPDDR